MGDEAHFAGETGVRQHSKRPAIELAERGSVSRKPCVQFLSPRIPRIGSRGQTLHVRLSSSSQVGPLVGFVRLVHATARESHDLSRGAAIWSGANSPLSCGGLRRGLLRPVNLTSLGASVFRPPCRYFPLPIGRPSLSEPERKPRRSSATNLKPIPLSSRSISARISGFSIRSISSASTSIRARSP